MSVLGYQEAIDSQNVQIYDNAAFDSRYVPSITRDSWTPLQPIALKQMESSESDCSKENRSPISSKSPITIKSLPPVDRTPPGRTLKLLPKQGVLQPPPQVEPAKIEEEIQQIEKEINRLTSRLQALQIEKVGQNSKKTRRQSLGRVVPAKFMEPKQSAKRVQESPMAFRRRGVSLGPLEIASASAVPSSKPNNRRKSCFWKLQEIGEVPEEKRPEARQSGRGRSGGTSRSLSPKPRASIRKTTDPRQGISTVGSKNPVRRDFSTLTPLNPKCLLFVEPKESAKKVKESPMTLQRRGVSLGPLDIASASAVPSSKPNNRRKSCSWKLQEIGEVPEEKPPEAQQSGRRRRSGGTSRSLSPKSRASIRKTTDPRQGISTVGAKNPVRRDLSTLTPLNPKCLLFKEAPPCNRPSKTSRVVPSRYSQTKNQQTPEQGRKARGVNSSCGRAPARSSRVKKTWEMPAQPDMACSPESSPSVILRIAENLPKIRTVRCVGTGTPRDSGPAKRVADLVGRRSYFDDAGEDSGDAVKSPVCHVLKFEVEE